MLALSESAKILKGRSSGQDVTFTSVTTDSRNIEAGCLFVALRGDRFDGHDFVAQALREGAAAAMVEEGADLPSDIRDCSLLHVADTRLALGELARHWRGCFEIPVIGVSGSNGKTTVKEMIAAILRAHYGQEHVLATTGNLNNDIGVPLTLLRLRDVHRAAVIELGINHPGETDLLAGYTQPTVGLINNAQREHQEFMKSVTDVAHEHADLFKHLSSGGIAVINADDQYAGLWREAASSHRIITFGINDEASVSAAYQLNDFGADLDLTCEQKHTHVSLQAVGIHNVRNAVAAAAGAYAAGVELSAIKAGLENFTPVKGRMQRIPARDGGMIIDDTYNANPDSVRAAIDVLARLKRPRILVLGDMGEVGDQGHAFHTEIGQYAQQVGIEVVYTLGDLSKASTEAFGVNAEHFTDIEALLSRLNEQLKTQPTLLVKGSRFMRMERIVEKLAEPGNASSSS
ncbi:UDP-N-acetylmuramoyl-tripeptide--D-alanyl-D-alanine ligase [Kaarinaea lacus]